MISRFRDANLILYLSSFGIILCSLYSSNATIDQSLLPRMLCVSIFILLFLVFSLTKKHSISKGVAILSIPFFLFIIFAALSIIWATNKSLAYLEVSKLILFFLLFLFFQNILLKYKDLFLSLLLKAILILFLLSCLKLVYQLFQISDFSYSSLYSITGISGHKNLYSSFIFLTTICSFFSLLYFKNYWRLIALTSIIIQIGLVVLLRSRAVWIGYIVSFLSIGILQLMRNKPISRIRRVVYISVSLLVISLLMLIVLPRIIDRYIEDKPLSQNISQIADPGTLTERLLIWDKSYQLISDNTFWGVGAGNWKICVQEYSVPEIYKVQDLNVIFQRPHNEFIAVLSQYGITGFILLLIFGFSLLFQLLSKGGSDSKSIDNLLIAGFLGYSAISFFSFPMERAEHNILLAILLGISAYRIRGKSKLNPGKEIKIPRAGVVLAILLCLFSMVTVLFSFRGEKYLKKMLIERSIGNDKKVVALCDSAFSVFYKTDLHSTPVHWYRGNANVNLENYDEAFTDFNTALKEHPYHPQVLNDMGSIYYLKSDIDSAIYYYTKSSEINPRYDEPKLNLVAIHINMGEYALAHEWNESILHDSERRRLYKEIIEENTSSEHTQANSPD